MAERTAKAALADGGGECDRAAVANLAREYLRVREQMQADEQRGRSPRQQQQQDQVSFDTRYDVRYLFTRYYANITS
jgi:hypothetical protein